MFKREFDEKVGDYLKKLIERKGISQRQFCKEYLVMRGRKIDDEDFDNEWKRMCNRLSQIIKGRKSIQTYDLPIFTELLGVSCEEILSCGKSFVPVRSHVTNYQVAFSKNPKEWEEYFERPDKLILNPDEYNKTVIDYAIEFKNYAFIKYLMDKGAIWFVDNSENDRKGWILGFSAGTNIKRREIGYIDTALNNELYYQCEERGLRQSVIAMAMENRDYDILDQLRAREIPVLYQLCSCWGTVKIHCRDYYDDEVIDAIAKSNGEVFRYFTTEFPVADRQGREHLFIYPFLGALIEKLIEQKSRYAEVVLRAALDHNERVYSQLQFMINEAAEHVRDNYPDWLKFTEDDVKSAAMNDYVFIVEDGCGSYMFSRGGQEYVRMCFNVVKSDAKSKNFLIDSLIKKVNDSFEAVQNIEPVIDIWKGERK